MLRAQVAAAFQTTAGRASSQNLLHCPVSHNSGLSGLQGLMWKCIEFERLENIKQSYQSTFKSALVVSILLIMTCVISLRK